ncbi:nuclear transport factor 2 family protein [Flavihumibacter sp. CACIAM 22H1]|uniref:nuclear transport factor 2 family protein n=1 Tax=Flavihumibacter sp. CACIAM 22H1 TaxID=1812911 RepID=UPI0007A8DB83|nr:nuclear transport factor 2 family protein [Flavihumibacter sp. CACIAM 22H1]KYP14366.1 MAG: hypothetical protein A1D16_11610 [Flavihumibacter sp. CACIAM 22H1]
MKKLVVVVMLLVSAIGQAQTKEEAAVYAELDRLNAAIVDKQQAVLETICHDKIWYGHSNGRLDDKAAFIKDVMEGPVDFSSLDAEERTIRMAGKNATVRFVFQAKAKNKGEEVVIRIGVMTVWVKEKAGWKLLARQAYKL